MNRLNRTLSLAILAVMAVSACTSIPEQFEGDYTNLKPKEVSQQDLETRVRWAGVILETRPEDGHTCFEILSRQLETSMRPENADQSNGRFVACKRGFYDPEVFKKKREVTLTGKLIHIDARKIGDFDYNFPVVDIEFMTLWPVRRYRSFYNYGPYRPYYWHYPHHGPYWRYPY
jgi:outer membrane lipoprotein